MATTQEMVDAYKLAEQDVLTKGVSYSIQGRTFTRANLREIREGRIEWEQKLNDESAAADGVSNDYSLASWE